MYLSVPIPISRKSVYITIVQKRSDEFLKRNVSFLFLFFFSKNVSFLFVVYLAWIQNWAKDDYSKFIKTSQQEDKYSRKGI